MGCSIFASSKSLSPVIMTSALAFIAARSIGLSSESRTSCSTSYLSLGTVTISSAVIAIARKDSSSWILSGSLRLKVRRNSSMFCWQMIPVLGEVTALTYALNGVPLGLSAEENKTFESISTLVARTFASYFFYKVIDVLFGLNS